MCRRQLRSNNGQAQREELNAEHAEKDAESRGEEGREEERKKEAGFSVLLTLRILFFRKESFELLV